MLIIISRYQLLDMTNSRNVTIQLQIPENVFQVIQSQNTVAVVRNMSGSAGPFSGVIGGLDSLTLV